MSAFVSLKGAGLATDRFTVSATTFPANVDSASWSSRNPVFAAGLGAALLSVLIIGLFAYDAAREGPFAKGAFVATYDDRYLDDPLEQMLVEGDGMAYAAQARDPSMARGEEIFRSDWEAAYRWQRPLLPYLAWAGSLGRTGWVPPAMAVIAVLGWAAAVAGVCRLLLDRRAPHALAPLVLIVPGALVSMRYLGIETLALALSAWALVAWPRDRRAMALVLLTLAALTRESLLLVPAGLALDALAHRRWRDVAMLATPFVAFLAWCSVVRVRVGSWPWGVGQDRIGPPFLGLVRAVRGEDLSDTLVTMAYGLVLLALGVVCVVYARRDPLVYVVVPHLVFATMIGNFVWRDWTGFGRTLLPLAVLEIVVLAGWLSGRSRRQRISVRS